ncbi:hypothetical protein KKD81_01235 [Patescibacteria group bacterium]|nr:hypothetical protein [Patescibacteria group bacterium]MBU2159033.1 hypothetical protein [Patescibacteria group bacterium]MBU2220541.1 hypothetical protein [Patescibacteria group bacterium]
MDGASERREDPDIVVVQNFLALNFLKARFGERGRDLQLIGSDIQQIVLIIGLNPKLGFAMKYDAVPPFLLLPGSVKGALAPFRIHHLTCLHVLPS